jgi:hypothetical protein
MGSGSLGRLELAVALGAVLPTDHAVPMSAGMGTLGVTSFPTRVQVGWKVAVAPRLTLVAAAGGGLELVVAETHGLAMTRRSTALEPTLEAGLRAVLALTQSVWIDLQAFQGLDVRPEEFQVVDPNMHIEIVSVTPRAYTRLGVDFGVFLGKN